MTKQTLANIALVLALMLLPMTWISFGVVFSTHEPSARGVMVVGILTPLSFIFLLVAAWLAGYSYTEAKKRSIVSSLCCASYVFALIWLSWKG